MKGVCLICRRHFEAVTERGVYCSGRCRAEASRRKKAQAQEHRDREIRASLDEAAQAIQRGRLAVSGEAEDLA